MAWRHKLNLRHIRANRSVILDNLNVIASYAVRDDRLRTTLQQVRNGYDLVVSRVIERVTMLSQSNPPEYIQIE